MNCPRCGLINPGTAQRCDCGYDFISESVQASYLTSAPNTSPSKIAIGAQVVALVLAGAAVIWGCSMVYVALYPGGSGEFGGISVLFAAMVDTPVGLVSIVVGLAVRKGLPVLRWACVVLSIIAIAMPFLTKVAWQSHFRVK